MKFKNMTQQYILEGNRLIAIFMGGEFRTDLKFAGITSGWINTPANDNIHIAQDYNLKYHKSFDWLIPVIEKINSTKIDNQTIDVIIYKTTCHINNSEQIIIEATGENMIEAVYVAIIQFINQITPNHSKKPN